MLNYPLTLSFKLIALSPQVRVTDASGQLVLYVKQKALALREDVRIFADEGQTQQLYQINANKIIDFSATYNLARAGGGALGAAGAVGRTAGIGVVSDGIGTVECRTTSGVGGAAGRAGPRSSISLTLAIRVCGSKGLAR